MGTLNRWGPKDLTWGRKASRAQSPVSGPSRSRSTTSVKSSMTHKLIYAILITSRKLRHYFQAH